MSERKIPTAEGWWWAKYKNPHCEEFETVVYVTEVDGVLRVQDDSERIAQYWDRVDQPDRGVTYEWLCPIPDADTLGKQQEFRETMQGIAKNGLHAYYGDGRINFERRWIEDGVPMIESILIEPDGTFDLTMFRDSKVIDMKECYETWKNRMAKQAAELTELRRLHEERKAQVETRLVDELIGKLPKTADWHPIILGQNLYAVIEVGDENLEYEVVECGFLTMTLDGDTEEGTVRDGDGHEYDIRFSDCYHIKENADAAIVARKGKK